MKYGIGSATKVASRTASQSAGPSFAPIDVDKITSSEADSDRFVIDKNPAVYYPWDSQYHQKPWGHSDMLMWGVNKDINNTQELQANYTWECRVAGAVMVPGTKTLLCIGYNRGWQGGRIAYKSTYYESWKWTDHPNSDPNKGPHPDAPDKGIEWLIGPDYAPGSGGDNDLCRDFDDCRDPDDPRWIHTGGYGVTKPDDRQNFYWLYDIDDLVRGYTGETDPRSVQPYDWGVLSVPYEGSGDSLHPICGMDYDAENDKLYLAVEEAADNAASPIYLVYNLNPPDEPAPEPPDPTDPPPAGIVFETNWANDTGISEFNDDQYSQPTTLWGWDARKQSRGGGIDIVPEGVDGTNALRITYPDANTTQPTWSLQKHLTNIDASRGFEELYIRYKFKLPDNFRAGDGQKMTYWKWLRLYQNTGAWTENREDSGFAVSNFGGNPPYGPHTGMEVPANEGENLDSGSAGGERYSAEWYKSGVPTDESTGHFEHIGASGPGVKGDLAFDANGWLENTPQTWHTIEWRLKLSTSATAWDGIYEIWFDGVLQNPFVRWEEKGGAPAPVNHTNMPTMKRSGYNFFTFFDNMVEWHKHWADADVDGRILINDVVVSTERITHEYNAGNTDNTGAT